jgi:DNA repair protein RecN (Recombination protein N)
MLITLRIKNLALVSDLVVEFQPGFNVITGETGAGKSILIGALDLVLGERADRTMLRAGCDNGAVEAVFDITQVRAPLQAFLEEHGLEPCPGKELVLRRSFTTAGANRQFVNGSPTTLNVLAALGEALVDMHGPHDHQSLLHPARQLGILDSYGKLSPLRARFAELLARQQRLLAERASLVTDEKAFAQQLDLLRFQFNEISAAKLQPDEEPRLQEEFQRASNATRLIRLSETARGLLNEDENSLLSQAGVLGRSLQELHKIDPDAGSLVELHEQAVAALQELQSETVAYADRLEIDPLRFQELEERLNLIQGLKRKYGSSLAAVIEFGEKAKQRMIQLEQSDAELIRIDDALEKINVELRKAGQEISNQRRQLIPKLTRAVVKQLTDLGFKQSQFEIALESVDPKAGLPERTISSGFDTVEFQFAPNPGEPARPLRAIASSGELARVMLALKTVLAAEDEIPVLVFDEVDANVGGETAKAVGEKMCQIARQRQVLCITHLAPVAAPANAHFVVTKSTEAGRTTSDIQLLDPTERVTELARMLGGQSEAARRHAHELLNRER